MKKGLVKNIMFALSAIMVLSFLGGCSSGSNEKKSDTKSTKAQGSITAVGSTALQPLVDKLGKKFTDENPDATITVQGGGSGKGITAVSDKTADLGDSDVTADVMLKDTSKVNELVDHKVCGIGFSLCVNNDVQISSLTKEQIQKIFTGEVTNWKDVGGNDEKITVINRPATSGTRATFKTTVMDGKDEKAGLGVTQDANGSDEQTCEQTKGSITYLALSYLIDPSLKGKIKQININGVAPTQENIESGKYPFWSYEHIYTNGEAKGLAKTFLDYMTNSKNAKATADMGYTPLGKIKASK